MNTRLLDSRMVEKGISNDKLAQELGINQATLYRKKSGASDFYRKEIRTIKRVLNLSDKDIDLIFFGE